MTNKVVIGLLLLTIVLARPVEANTQQVPDRQVVNRISTHMSAFGIPYSVDSENGQYIEVQLFVSSDLGKSWQFHSRQPTSGNEFPFQATGDGEYWFALKTLDRDRRLLPEGQNEPELKIEVDTKKPGLDFRVQPDAAGRVVCRWSAVDQNIDPTSAKIFYRSAAIGPEQTWQQVQIQLNGQVQLDRYEDQIAWWPKTDARNLEVRMEVADRAQNTVSELRKITVPQAAWKNRGSATARKSQRHSAQPPFQSTGQTASNHGQLGVVCENGICRLPEPGASVPNHSFSNASTSKKKPVIGSQPEWAAPPSPVGNQQANLVRNEYVEPRRQLTSYPQTEFNELESVPRPDPLTSGQHHGQQRLAPRTIDWGAEPEESVAEHLMVQGSTRNRNQAAATNLLKQSAPNSPKLSGVRIKDLPSPLKSEPGKTSLTYAGDQFISESTTGRWNPEAAKRSNPRGHTPKVTLGPERQGRAVGGDFVQRQTDELISQNRPEQLKSVAEQKGDSFKNAGYLPQPGMSPNPTAKRPTSIPNQPSSNYLPSKLGEVLNVNSRQFSLKYGIDAIDPSGVEKVVLWMTRDGGQSWKSWATDTNNTSPITVAVKEQGVYGFRIVVHSNDGLTGIAPRRNDTPDVMVNVDLDAPLVRITSVPYGRGVEAGKLVVNWQAEDENLTLRPITLAYAESETGPWTIIEHGIRNTGRYVWKVGTGLPERLFLKIESRDLAGNVGVFQLQNQIDISGLVPRGRIHGVQPIR